MFTHNILQNNIPEHQCTVASCSATRRSSPGSLELVWAVPPDFFLSTRLKSSLKGHHFGTVKNVQAAVTNALKEIPVQDFQASYDAWQNSWQRCIDAQGCYFEEYCV